jgi:glycosyltransferase involved in cell wall biosynthesis
MAGLQLKSKYGVKFLFDIRGLWADERVEGGLWNLRNPLFNSIYHYFKRQEQQMFNAADAIISLTAKAVPIIRSIQKQDSKKNPVEVIPCCVDTHLFDPATIRPEQQIALRNELGVPANAFLLCYLGGIGTWYKAEEMFDFFSRLLVRFPEAYFFFITREPQEVLTAMASKRNIPASRIIVKAVKRKEIPLHLSIADASIYFIMDSFSKQASSPTKQGEVMSMGIPLICNPGVGDSSDILEASHTGYICKGYNVDAYDKIVAYIEFPSKPEERKHIREVAIKNFSLEDGVRKYLSVYKKLLQE